MAKKRLLVLLSWLALFGIFFYLLHSNFYAPYRLRFEAKKLSPKRTVTQGSVYFSEANVFIPQKQQGFVYLRRQRKFLAYSIPLRTDRLEAIRLDPLPAKGEVIIKNVAIKSGGWWNKKAIAIDLKSIDKNTLHNIKIKKRTHTLLRIRATGADPHLTLARGLGLKNPPIDLRQISLFAILAAAGSSIVLLTLLGLWHKKLFIEDLLTAILLICYALYALLFSVRYELAEGYLYCAAIISAAIIFLQGIRHYRKIAFKGVVFLLALSLVYGISAIFSGGFDNYMVFLPTLAMEVLLAISFYRPTRFNLSFYSRFFYTLTLLYALAMIALQFEIVDVERTVAFGYLMSESNWTQKNYAYFFVLLFFTTLGVVGTKPLLARRTIALAVLTILATIAIFSNYSASAKGAFVLSLGVYAIVQFRPLSARGATIVSSAVVLYILLFPLIFRLFDHLRPLMPQLNRREAIFHIYPDLVAHHPIFGIGFQFPHTFTPKAFISSDLALQYGESFFAAKYLPHAVPMLLWTGAGLVGVAVVSPMIFWALRRSLILSRQNRTQPAVVALTASMLLITTFSWGVWHVATLLTFAFFVGFVLFLLSKPQPKENIII